MIDSVATEYKFTKYHFSRVSSFNTQAVDEGVSIFTPATSVHVPVTVTM